MAIWFFLFMGFLIGLLLLLVFHHLFDRSDVVRSCLTETKGDVGLSPSPNPPVASDPRGI